MRNTARAIAADATLTGLDLAQWLPTAGLREPILGIAGGTLHVTGTPAAPAFAATAAVNNALVYGYPLSTFTLTANGDTHAAHVEAVHMAGPGLTADASGSFGYGPSDPIGNRVARAERRRRRAGESAGSEARSGRRDHDQREPQRHAQRAARPQTLDATNLRSHNYTLPHAHLQLAADPQTVNLQTLEADFTARPPRGGVHAADPSCRRSASAMHR